MSKMESDLLAAAGAASIETDQRDLQRRKKLFLALGATLLAGAAGWGAYEYLHASRFVSTDNAYVATETAQVTPAIAGIVRAVHAADTQRVARGEVLVELDDTDARLALAQAE